MRIVTQDKRHMIVEVYGVRYRIHWIAQQKRGENAAAGYCVALDECGTEFMARLTAYAYDTYEPFETRSSALGWSRDYIRRIWPFIAAQAHSTRTWEKTYYNRICQVLRISDRGDDYHGILDFAYLNRDNMTDVDAFIRGYSRAPVTYARLTSRMNRLVVAQYPKTLLQQVTVPFNDDPLNRIYLSIGERQAHQGNNLMPVALHVDLNGRRTKIDITNVRMLSRGGNRPNHDLAVYAAAANNYTKDCWSVPEDRYGICRLDRVTFMFALLESLGVSDAEGMMRAALLIDDI